MNRILAGIFWIALYLAVVLSPLVVMMVRPTPAERSFWVEASLGLGFVGLVQLAVQFALIARYRRLTAPYGIDLIMQYHRQIGSIAIVLVAAHPLVLILENPTLAGLLSPVGGSWASRTGNWALYALVVLAVLSYFRKRLGLGYEAWRATHALLGTLALGCAHAHVHLAGQYTGVHWKEAVLIGISGVMLSFFGYLRLVKPLLQRRTPYRVTALRPEQGDTWTLTLTADGHPGLPFKPGQFAWLKLGGSPYSLQEHPFSFSSSAQDTRNLEFGIKELGDFTGRIGEVPLGTRAYVDGPHGDFSTDLSPAAGYVFVAGGVGVTPFLSMLRTMADRGDRRPVLLFYCARSPERAAFRADLEALERRMALEVVYVFERPPEGWEGESGYLDEALLRRRLPREGITRLYFVCGPDPMMDAVEHALRRLGVPMARIRSERFELV